MDKGTHISVTNCIKELDALSQLVASEKYSMEDVADWIAQISWELSGVFRRRRYNSDEFRLKLRQLVKERKQEKNKIAEEDEDAQ